MSKLPAIQFYPGDWKKDVGVQALSFHDRGVWFEILLLMHESERRGMLLLNGKAMPEDALSRVIGLDKQNLTTTITTLLETGVASRDEDTGALVSRRMMRDENIRQVRTDAGKKGGNPALLNQKTSTEDKQIETTGDKQIPTPSSSVSSSSSKQEQNMSLPVEAHPEASPAGSKSKHPDLLIYEQYPRKEGKGSAMVAIAKAVKQIERGEPHDDTGVFQAPCDLMTARRKLFSAVQQYAKSPAGRNPDRTKIPHPATWFNQKRYLDERSEWQHTAGAVRGSGSPAPPRIYLEDSPEEGGSHGSSV